MRVNEYQYLAHVSLYNNPRDAWGKNSQEKNGGAWNSSATNFENNFCQGKYPPHIDFFDGINETANAVWNDICETSGNVCEDVSATINNVVTPYGDAVRDICEDVGAVCGDIGETVSGIHDSIVNAPQNIDNQIDKLNSDGDNFSIKGGLKVAVGYGGRGGAEFTVTYKESKMGDYYEVKIGGEAGYGCMVGAENLGKGVKAETWNMAGGKCLLRCESTDEVKQIWREIAMGAAATAKNYKPTGIMVPESTLTTAIAENLQGFETNISADNVIKAGIGKGLKINDNKSLNAGNVRFQQNLDGKLKVYFPNTESNPTENYEATVSCTSDIFYEGRLGPDLGFNKNGLQKGFWELGRFDLQTKATIEHEFTCSQGIVDFNDPYFIDDYNPNKTTLDLKFNASNSTTFPIPNSSAAIDIPTGFDEAGVKIEIKEDNTNNLQDVFSELKENGPYALDRCLDKEDVEITGYIKNGSNDFYKGAPGFTYADIGFEVSYQYGVQDYNPNNFKTNDLGDFFSELNGYLP